MSTTLVVELDMGMAMTIERASTRAARPSSIKIGRARHKPVVNTAQHDLRGMAMVMVLYEQHFINLTRALQAVTHVGKLNRKILKLVREPLARQDLPKPDTTRETGHAYMDLIYGIREARARYNMTFPWTF